MSDTRGKTFFGLIQGLPDRKIHDIMFRSGFKKEDYRLLKISLFKTSKNIVPRYSDVPLESKMDKKEIRRINKGIEADDYAGLELLEAGGEIGAIIAIIIFIIIGWWFLWILVIIPILILVMGLITLGESWKMLRVHLIKFRVQRYQTLEKIIDDVHHNGGVVSSKWLESIKDKRIIEQGVLIRRNYIGFMKGVSMTSYGLFFLTFLYFIDLILDAVFKIDLEPFNFVLYGFIGCLAGAGLFISIFHTTQQTRERSYLKNNLY